MSLLLSPRVNSMPTATCLLDRIGLRRANRSLSPSRMRRTWMRCLRSEKTLDFLIILLHFITLNNYQSIIISTHARQPVKDIQAQLLSPRRRDRPAKDQLNDPIRVKGSKGLSGFKQAVSLEPQVISLNEEMVHCQ